MAHDGGEQGGAQPPEGLVAHYGGGEADKPPGHLPAGPEEQGGGELEALVQQGPAYSDGAGQHPGQQGGQGRALLRQPWGAQVAEDEHPVEEGIAGHGGAQDDQPPAGVAHGPVDADVDLDEAVEEIGPAHDPGVPGGGGHHGGVAAEQAHELGGQEAHDEGEGEADGPGGVHADAHHPVDGPHVPLAPVLADEDGGAALDAEHHQLNHKNGDVGQSDAGQGALPHGAHHKGVHQAKGIGDKVLQQNG